MQLSFGADCPMIETGRCFALKLLTRMPHKHIQALW